jgi:hypothetical protein
METVTKKVNLLESLKGAPEMCIIIYCPVFGHLGVEKVSDNYVHCFELNDPKKRTIAFDAEGYLEKVFFGLSDTKRSDKPLLFVDENCRYEDWYDFKIDAYPALPSTWEVFCEDTFKDEMKDKKSFPYAEEVKSLQKLLILRDYYNRSVKKEHIDLHSKYNIICAEGKLRVQKASNTDKRIMWFQNELLAIKFLESFGNLLEDAKGLL